MTGGMKQSPIEASSAGDTALPYNDSPPEDDAITDYDEAHFALYLELLHAEGHGSTVEQMAREAFGLNPLSEPARSAAVVNSHLRRAHWLCKAGARHFRN